MRKTFIDTLTEISRLDENVMCIIGDTGFSVFEEYEKEFGSRFVNVGIAEQNFVSFGAGLAAMGMKPFIYNVVSFMVYRAFEQIELDVAYQNNPVVLVGVGGGHAYGTAGPTHHGYFDIAMMTQLPNMTVMCPADPVEMRAVMYAAYHCNTPVYIRIGRSVDPVIHTGKIDFQVGKAIKMKEGNDVAIFATGTMVKDALVVTKELEVEGIKCDLYSMPTVKPIDTDTIMEVAGRCQSIYTIEEHSTQGGLGDAVGRVLLDKNLRNVKLCRIGFPDCFAPVTGTREYLNAQYGMDIESIKEQIKKDLRTGT